VLQPRLVLIYRLHSTSTWLYVTNTVSSRNTAALPNPLRFRPKNALDIYTNPLRVRNAVSPLGGGEVWNARHIYLPFNLRVPGAWHDDGNQEILNALFDNVEIGFDGWALILCIAKLPPHPGLKTVAGDPLYIATSQADRGPLPPTRIRGDVNGKIRPRSLILSSSTSSPLSSWPASS
jgi:hypothetical protein